MDIKKLENTIYQSAIRAFKGYRASDHLNELFTDHAAPYLENLDTPSLSVRIDILQTGWVSSSLQFYSGVVRNDEERDELISVLEGKLNENQPFSISCVVEYDNEKPIVYPAEKVPVKVEYFVND